MFDKTEEEQIQIIKEWFQKNYLWILTIILVAGLGIFGWNYQKQSTQDTQLKASGLYNDIQNLSLAITSTSNLDERDSLLEQMNTSTETISSLYEKSIYTMLCRQVYASTLARLGNFDEAIKQLQLLTSTDDPLIHNTSIISLAKINWEQNKVDEALQLLKKIDKEAGWYAIAKELEGDILFSVNNFEEAEKAYQESMDYQTTTNNLLRLKLDYVSK